MTRLGWMLAQAVVFGGMATSAALASDREIYTLYRSSVTDSRFRIHVATFDAHQPPDTEVYNRENCLIAAKLFQQQPGVTVSYWCEPGKYRK